MRGAAVSQAPSEIASIQEGQPRLDARSRFRLGVAVWLDLPIDCAVHPRWRFGLVGRGDVPSILLERVDDAERDRLPVRVPAWLSQYRNSVGMLLFYLRERVRKQIRSRRLERRNFISALLRFPAPRCGMPQLSDDASGISDSKRISRKTAHDDRSCAHDRVVSDGDARTDHHSTAEPDVVSNRDRLRAFPFRASPLAFQRVRRREELDVGTDLHVVADRDRRHVEGDEAEIDERPRTEADVVAVIAMERRTDRRAVAQPAEQLAQDPSPLLFGFRPPRS